MNRASRRMCTVTAASSALLLAVACRAIIGVNPVTYEPPDSGAHDSSVEAAVVPGDAGDGGNACPSSPPTVLFTVPGTLSQPFVAGGNVFALVSTKGAVRALFSGFVACSEKGCDGGARAWPVEVQPDSGTVFGTASGSDAGVFYSVTSGGGSVDASAGSVEWTSFDGGGARALASKLAYPYVVSASGGDVYWSNDPTALSGAGSALPVWDVWHASASGGAGAAVFFQGSGGSVISLFADAKNVYAFAQDSTQAYGLFVCPRAGCPGAPRELVQALPPPNGNQFTGVDSFASDGTSLFHASLENGEITSVSFASGDENDLTDNLNSPSFLAAAGGYLYWATADGVVERIKSDGTGAVNPLLCGLTNVTGIVLDGPTLYALETDPGNVANTAMVTVSVP